MNILAAYKALGPVDWKNVRRDALLAWVVAVPLLLALLYRVGVPPLTALLARELGFDLTPYYDLLISFYVLLAPAMTGMVVGFLLLDERDDGVLTALLVTPMPPGSYLLYRVTAPLGLGFAVTLAGYPLAGLLPLPVPDLLAVAALAAFAGPLTALFLAGFAENKVSGFAMVKVLNTINMIPVLAYFVPARWQAAAGVVPGYWPMKMLWQAADGAPYAAYALGGLLVNAALLALLLRRFVRVMHR